MKDIKTIWIPAAVVVAAIVCAVGFIHFNRVQAVEAEERNMILETAGDEQARIDAKNGQRKVYLIWDENHWSPPGIHEPIPARFEQVRLRSTRKLDLYGDSSDYRTQARLWALRYNQTVSAID